MAVAPTYIPAVKWSIPRPRRSTLPKSQRQSYQEGHAGVWQDVEPTDADVVKLGQEIHGLIVQVRERQAQRAGRHEDPDEHNDGDKKLQGLLYDGTHEQTHYEGQDNRYQPSYLGRNRDWHASPQDSALFSYYFIIPSSYMYV